ncbi:MAG: glutamate-5-semialdehyde dehydrogenase [Actinomycetota bacterium]
MSGIAGIGLRARRAAAVLAQAPAGLRSDAIEAMAKAVSANLPVLLEVNARDVEAARAGGAARSTIDRLTLTASRIDGMVSALGAIAAQPDPLGVVLDEWTRPNGIRITKVRVPIGVVAVIYESRPNVTVDVAGLCVKSGNAALLRGSSLALHSNVAITGLLREAAASVGLPEDSVVLVEDTSREAAVEVMQLDGLVDLLIPRGGAALVQSIRDNATVPFIIDGDGNCHVYVDAAADPEKATAIVMNAKVQRPSVCNAAETLVVHEDIASRWLPQALDALAAAGVEIRGDEAVRALWPAAVPATEADWGTEYLDLILAVKVVGSLDEAIAHVNRWGTSNTEAIVSEDPEATRRFAAEVDTGTVFVNCSTRFSDGGEFGFGAEIGISTQKLHARGPMGLEQLTTYRYVVWGDGQVRT